VGCHWRAEWSNELLAGWAAFTVNQRAIERLADNALVEVLRVPAQRALTNGEPAKEPTWRQPGDKAPRIKTEKSRGVSGGPSRVRTRPQGKKRK
jgi:hypothetical protein